MTLQDWIQFIQGVGFPIAVAGYLLVVINTTIKDNTQVLRDLKIWLEARSTQPRKDGEP